MDKAQENIINKLNTIADNRHSQDKVSKDLQWKAFLDVFLNNILDEDTNHAAKFNQVYLREGEEVYFTNNEIIGMLEVDYPELAVAYKSMIQVDQDDFNSVMYDIEDAVKDSVYADVFKSNGYSIMLHIHDEPVEWAGKDENGEYKYHERYVDGIGLELIFNGHKLSMGDDGINEKTGKYQYVTYSDCTE